MAITLVLSFLLALSAAANAFLYIQTKKQKAENPGDDSRAVLSDIIRGQSLVRIVRVAPEDVLIRSPRGFG